MKKEFEISKKNKINSFDPSGMGDLSQGIYGLPFSMDEARVAIVPYPWEVTVSSGGGTSKGPEAVLNASYQVDLFDPVVKDAWKIGIAMEEISPEIAKKSKELRAHADAYIKKLSKGENPDSPKMKKSRDLVNAESKKFKEAVKKISLMHLNEGRIVAHLGGDHSTPLGLMEALAEKFGNFGILQIDAHCDLREAYEGFEYSHASIMYNALKIKEVKKLVQVGIRDLCEDEFNLIKNSKKRVETFFDRDMKHAEYGGKNWKEVSKQIVSKLPKLVYLSFDIDGLDPKYCSSTGTPVPGGLEFEQALYLIEAVVASGRKIISFDLNEVGPEDWDANVAARLLYRISNLAAKSNGFA